MTDAADRPAERVLIVEDDPAQARLLQALVAGAGYAVLGPVGTAAEALALAAQADIVLLDHQLGSGRTGLDVLREMRDVSVSAAVVMVTAHGSEQLVADAFRLGADDYVVKDAALAEALPATLTRLARVRRIGDALRTNRGDVLRSERRAGAQAMVLSLSHEAAGPLHALATRLEVLQLDAANLTPSARLQLAAAHEDLTHLTELLERAREMVGTPPEGERPR